VKLLLSILATDGYSTASERARLTVDGRGGQGGGGGQIPPGDSRPDVTITPQYLTLPVGSPAEFRCPASGYPPPTLPRSGGRNGQLPSHARSQGGLLSFSSIRKSDEAEYHCRAENSNGIASLRTILYVQGEDDSESPPPTGLSVSVMPADADARPGDTVRMRCDASDPSARIVWARSGGALPQASAQTPDGQLTIFAASDEDSGVYTCTATTSSGQSAQGQGRLQVSYAG